MLHKFLTVLLLLGTLVVAEIPSYMKICGRRNPNLAQCVKDSVEGLRGKLRSGMPELDIQPFEPTQFKGFLLSDTPQLKAYASNVQFSGFTNFEIKDLKIDLESQQLELEVLFKKLVLDAEYDINAKILVPIQGKGPIHITTSNVEAKVTMKYKFMKRNGEDYVFFTAMTTKLNIQDYKADFKPSVGAENEVLRTAVHAAIAEGSQDILGVIKPSIEKVVSEEVLRLSNNICKHFTYNELFPDRE